VIALWKVDSIISKSSNSSPFSIAVVDGFQSIHTLAIQSIAN